MQIPDWLPSDFAAGMQALMPRGRAWPRDPAAVQSQVIAAMVPTWQRVAAAGKAALSAVFPATADAMLPEWEATLGLPDPCAGESPTIQQRQAQVVARLTDAGGASIADFEAYAATLGFEITISQFVPRRFGMAFGTPMYGVAWAFTWQVNTAAVTIDYRQFGQQFGQPYATWGGSVLQCEFERLKPAHTIILFNYTGGPAVGLWGSAVWGKDSWG